MIMIVRALWSKCGNASDSSADLLKPVACGSGCRRNAEPGDFNENGFATVQGITRSAHPLCGTNYYQVQKFAKPIDWAAALVDGRGASRRNVQSEFDEDAWQFRLQIICDRKTRFPQML